MILVIGAASGRRLLQRRAWRWIAAFALLSGVMVYAERQIFPNSRHIMELRGMRRRTLGSRLSVDQPEYAQGCTLRADANYIRSPMRMPKLSSDRRAQHVAGLLRRTGESLNNRSGAELGVDAGANRPRQDSVRRRTQCGWTGLKPMGVTWVVLRRAGLDRSFGVMTATPR